MLQLFRQFQATMSHQAVLDRYELLQRRKQQVGALPTPHVCGELGDLLRHAQQDLYHVRDAREARLGTFGRGSGTMCRQARA